MMTPDVTDEDEIRIRLRDIYTTPLEEMPSGSMAVFMSAHQATSNEEVSQQLWAAISVTALILADYLRDQNEMERDNYLHGVRWALSLGIETALELTKE